MKILVVCQYYSPEPFRISDICEALVNKGHEVTVLTGLPNYPEGKVLSEYKRGKKRNEVLNGVKLIRSFEIGRGNNSLKLFLNYISFPVSSTLKVLFTRKKYDVVMVNQLSPVLMAIPAIVYKKKFKKKILLYCLDLWPASLAAGGIKKESLVYKVFKEISKWIYQSADAILVSSNMFIEYFSHTLEVKNKNFKHLPQYAEDLFSEVVGEEDKNENKYNFVFAGNIGDMQSVETIVKAADILADRQNLMFHIVGDGSKLQDCINLSEQLGLKNIIFHGRKPLNEMPKYYSMADAMLITLKDDETISYTLPGKIQSYMAAKKPIIGAINGETSYIIQQAKCGLCCVAEDYKSLSEIIIEFSEIENKEQLASNSYKYYSENYNKEKFIESLENSLMQLGGK